jgi:hypothetical protein
VSARTGEERGALGKSASGLLARLPLDEPDPRARLQRVIETVSELEESSPGVAEAITDVADDLLPGLATQLARIVARGSGANLVVTNLPGPRNTVYLLGAPLRAVYPLFPLPPTHALGIALFSYAGGLFWGINSDWDELPDLHDFVDAIGTEFQALQEAAGVGSVAAS